MAKDAELGELVFPEEWTPVVSSNVAAILYHPERQELNVAYKWGGVYGYGEMSEDEAHYMFYAASHGTFVWDELRVRGTVYGHKKPYWRIS